MEEESFNIVFFNCNSSKLLQGFEGDCYPELKPIHRIDPIIDRLIDPLDDYTILILFEIDDTFFNGFISHIIHKMGYYYNYANYNINSDDDDDYINTSRYIVITKIRDVVGTLRTFPLSDGIYEKNDRMIIRINLYDLDIYCVHLTVSNKIRKQQIGKLINIVKNESMQFYRRFIIGGDFNTFNNDSNTNNLTKTKTTQLEYICKGLNAICVTRDVKTTFNPFPYDINFLLDESDRITINKIKKTKNLRNYRTYCDAMCLKYDITNCGALDHIFLSQYDFFQSISVNFPENFISDHYIMKVVVKL